LENGVRYPDSDGKPMADNTEQFLYLTTIKEGLDGLLLENVFVGGDLLWYPVEGRPKIRMAPDVLVAFGRPKGKRGSYRQWREENVAPQVVFEVLSPGNRRSAMGAKWSFYQRYGVEEYYLYDPDHGILTGWLRRGDVFEEIPEMRGWISPRLQLRFELEGTKLRLYDPTGRPFLNSDQIYRAHNLAEEARARAEDERDRVARERDEANRERDAERARVERLEARLRELGLDVGA
jgi:Uma2 family endonuclease